MSRHLRILVTGGTGFIGNHLVETLIKEHEVKCLIRKTSNIKFLNKMGVELLHGDITNKKSLEHAIKDVDYVFHLAAAIRKNISREDFFKINVNGTENLLNVCKNTELERIIYFSTTGVYGPTKNLLTNENSPYNPSTSYEISKCEGEKIAINFIKSGLPITIIQPAVVYGPRENSSMLKLFNSIKNKKFFFIRNSENNKIHLVYVENLIKGVILASKEKKAIGKGYIIGDEKALPFFDFVQNIANLLDVSIPKFKLPNFLVKIAGKSFEKLGNFLNFNPPISTDTIKFLTENHAYDISKAKKELGYSPTVHIKEGIGKTIEWYKINGFL